MAQVVGAKLSLEAVFGYALRAGHDAGVRNQQVKSLTLSQQLARAGAGATALSKLARCLTALAGDYARPRRQSLSADGLKLVKAISSSTDCATWLRHSGNIDHQ